MKFKKLLSFLGSLMVGFALGDVIFKNPTFGNNYTGTIIVAILGALMLFWGYPRKA